MTKRIVFIHGINNQDRSRGGIQTLWSDALCATLGEEAKVLRRKVVFDTAYYADILHKEDSNWKLFSSSGIRMSASSPQDDYVDFDVAALFLEFQKKFEITDEQISENLSEGDDVAGTRQAAGVHKKWIKALTRTLEKMVPSAGNSLARIALSQAATYLNKPGVFDKINNLVSEQVFADHKIGDRTVVIAHSLGTVIAYVLLRKMKPHPSFPLFLTLGSPLGIEVVRRRIGPPLLNPPPALKWINGADPEDFVALHARLDKKSFGPGAAITNIADIDNGYEDAHSLEGYLSDKRVAKAVLEVVKD